MAKQRVLPALFAVALFLCVLLVAPSSYADSYARIVRLSDVDGSVQIDRNTGKGFENALPNMPITQGVRLQTGSTGRAEVEFENGSVVRLAADSSVEFTQLSLRSNGDRVSEVRVNDGLVYVNFKHKGDDDFRIDFANRGVDLTKDVHFRVRVEQGEAELAVFKGEVNIKGESESAKVKKNETFVLDLSDGARYELAKGITGYSSDDWDQERDQYLAQYASVQHGYNSPYSYGYSDLSYYGSFFDAPGYGLLWRPTAFGPGWDPYGNGYWSYYPGYGYIWISSYPWGWTPYRYGSWLYVPSYGWCWRPGNWNHWNTGVVVHNPPPTWHHPTPPPHGNPSTVVVGQPPTRPTRTIRSDDIRPRPPIQIPGTAYPNTVTRQDRDRRPTPAPTIAPATGAAASAAPTNQPNRQVDVERQTRTTRDEQFNQQNIRGTRNLDTQKITPTTPQTEVNRPSRQTTTPPPSPPPTSVQPVRPSPPPPRMESRPSPPPSPPPQVRTAPPSPPPQVRTAPPPRTETPRSQMRMERPMSMPHMSAPAMRSSGGVSHQK